MKKALPYIVAFISTVALCVWFQSCKLTTTTTMEPIKRQEVAPYIEQVMAELCDSCRLIQIKGSADGNEYHIKCKKTAVLVNQYLMKR